MLVEPSVELGEHVAHRADADALAATGGDVGGRRVSRSNGRRATYVASANSVPSRSSGSKRRPASTQKDRRSIRLPTPRSVIATGAWARVVPRISVWWAASNGDSTEALQRERRLDPADRHRRPGLLQAGDQALEGVRREVVAAASEDDVAVPGPRGAGVPGGGEVGGAGSIRIRQSSAACSRAAASAPVAGPYGTTSTSRLRWLCPRIDSGRARSGGSRCR